MHNFSVCMLASGSKGNAAYISNGLTSILVDAGLSGIEIERRLKSKGFHPENIDAILVSHEHSDHIRSVGVLSRRFNLPVYISDKTYHAASRLMGPIEKPILFESGTLLKIDSLKIHPFSLSHDAEDPVGFTIEENGTKIGIATDLGRITSLVKEHLKGCSLLILEANHDPDMLINGPYPWHLKQRIKSRTGHLSNGETKEFINEIKTDKLKYVILAHLSETNNTPQKALQEVGQVITHTKIQLTASAQDLCGDIFYIK